MRNKSSSPVTASVIGTTVSLILMYQQEKQSLEFWTGAYNFD